VGWTTSSGRSAAEFNRRYGVLGGALTKRKLDTPYPVRKGWVNEWVGSEQEDGGINHNAKKALQGKWENRWRAATRSASEAIQQPPDKRVLLLHEGLHKAESSIFTQVRTGKIGRADFLHGIGLPEGIRELNALLNPEHPNYHAYQVENIKAVINLYKKDAINGEILVRHGQVVTWRPARLAPVATKEKPRATPLSFARSTGPPETSSLSTVDWTSSGFSQRRRECPSLLGGG
jgi:hypothetical protein